MSTREMGGQSRAANQGRQDSMENPPIVTVPRMAAAEAGRAAMRTRIAVLAGASEVLSRLVARHDRKVQSHLIKAAEEWFVLPR
jgi:hypothetical protein